MRAFGPVDLQKWMPRGDLLAVDLPSFGKWMLTLAVSIFIVGAASTGTLNLVSNYAVRPVSSAVPAPSPAALRSVEPTKVLAASKAAEEAEPAPAPLAAAPAQSTSVAAAQTISASDAVPAEPRMMATLGLAVRARPQTASAQIGSLQQGEIVSVQAADRGWYLVTTHDGASGWSWGKYLEPVSPQIAADSPFWSAGEQEVAFAR
jgi:hypothetical protein